MMIAGLQDCGCIAWERLAREKRYARGIGILPTRDRLGSPGLCRVSIQQKTDSFCTGNRRSPTCALNKFGDRWNRNVFAAGKFISPAHDCRTLDAD